ncbi:MAG: ABC transporter permease [Acidobacteria bacterium]|nr:ABC transporter permease [Acidobacteriota bacterium]
MNLPLLLALRYLRRPTDRLVTLGGLLSLGGIVIGVTALVISMALMTGYRQDLEKKILGGNAEIMLFSQTGLIRDPDAMIARAESVEGVARAWPAVFQGGIVTSEKNVRGEEVMIKGLASPLPPGEQLARIVGGRELRSAGGEWTVAIGTHLARRLGVTVGEVVTITVPTERSGSFLPRSETWTVGNVYETGFFELDDSWLFTDIEAARQLLASPGITAAIEVHVVEGSNLDTVIAGLERELGDGVTVTDWRRGNQQLFHLLALQQFGLFLVIGMIVLVSTFNIVSMLVMTIHEKGREIALLITLGGESRLIRKTFIYYGLIVGIVGSALGVGIGVVASLIITRYELVSFGPEIAQVYFVSSIPFINRPLDLLTIAAFSIGICFIAAYATSSRATRVQPADALRHS